MQAISSRKRLCSSLSDSSSSSLGHEQENRPHRKDASCDLAVDCERFVQGHSMQSLVQQTQTGPLAAPFWWALSELNVTLSTFQHLFQDLTLLESHCFTRCEKSLAFEKLAFARGCTDAWTLQQTPHLQAVSLIMQTALASCHEAAISEITLRCPPFLAAWAARWLPRGGHAASAAAGPPRIKLTTLQGYRQVHGPLRAATVYNLGLPNITSTPAYTTIYVPTLN